MKLTLEAYKRGHHGLEPQPGVYCTWALRACTDEGATECFGRTLVIFGTLEHARSQAEKRFDTERWVAVW